MPLLLFFLCWLIASLISRGQREMHRREAWQGWEMAGRKEDDSFLSSLSPRNVVGLRGRAPQRRQGQPEPWRKHNPEVNGKRRAEAFSDLTTPASWKKKKRRQKDLQLLLPLHSRYHILGCPVLPFKIKPPSRAVNAPASVGCVGFHVILV